MRLLVSALLILVFDISVALGLKLQILDDSGRIMPGAHVSIIGQNGVWIADENGMLELDPPDTLPFSLLISRSDGVAMKPQRITSVPEDEDGFLTLRITGLGGTVTVVSSAVPDIEMAPAAASTIMGEEDLENRLPTSLSESLENIPGAGVTGEGHAAVPGLRGLPQHRTLLILDEGRLVTERRAGASATFLDPATLDEIEVIRGPGSVAYGSDAFGGVIRARSRMPGVAPEGSRLRYSLQGASGSPGFGATADYSTPLAGGGVLIGAQIRDYDDYQSPRGRVFDSRWKLWGVRASWEGLTGKGILRIGWRTDQAEDVGKPNPDSRYKRRFYPEEDSDRFGLSYETSLGERWRRMTLSLAWDRYRLVLDKDTRDGEGRVHDRKQSDVSAQDVEFRLEFERDAGPFRLVFGAGGFSRFDLDAVNRFFEDTDDGELVQIGKEVSIKSARSFDVGVFSAVSREVGPVHLALGLRFDGVENSNHGGYFGNRSTYDSSWSGFLAGRWSPGKGLELSGQYSRGFRSPLLSDRFYRGETGRGFITGNPDLEPETADQYDISLRFRSEEWQFGGYAYLYRIRDMIEKYKENGDYYFRNRAESEIRGVELEASTVLLGSISLTASAWWLRGEILDDAGPTNDVPAPGAHLVLRRDPECGLGWMARGAVFLEDDRPGSSEIRVGGYAVIDGAVNWTFPSGLRIQFSGRNLLDHAYPGSADEDAVLAPGRSFVVSMQGFL